MTDIFGRLAEIDHLHESVRCAHLGLPSPRPLPESLEEPDPSDRWDAEMWREAAYEAVERWFASLPRSQRERAERADIRAHEDGGVYIDVSAEEVEQAVAAMKAEVNSLNLGEFVAVRRLSSGSVGVRLRSDVAERLSRYHPAVLFGDFKAFAEVMVGLWRVVVAGARAVTPTARIPSRAQLLAPRPRRLDQHDEDAAAANLTERRIQPGGRELEPVSSEMMGRRLWMEIQADRDSIPRALWNWLVRSVTILAHGGGDQKMQRQVSELLAADTGRLIPPRTRAVLTMIADPTMMVTRG